MTQPATDDVIRVATPPPADEAQAVPEWMLELRREALGRFEAEAAQERAARERRDRDRDRYHTEALRGREPPPDHLAAANEAARQRQEEDRRQREAQAEVERQALLATATEAGSPPGTCGFALLEVREHLRETVHALPKLLRSVECAAREVQALALDDDRAPEMMAAPPSELAVLQQLGHELSRRAWALTIAWTSTRDAARRAVDARVAWERAEAERQERERAEAAAQEAAERAEIERLRGLLERYPEAAASA